MFGAQFPTAKSREPGRGLDVSSGLAMRNNVDLIGVDHQTVLCGSKIILPDERHRAAFCGTVSVDQVGRVGVEPTKSCLRRILSPLRLPIPPPPPANIVIAAWITSSRGGPYRFVIARSPTGRRLS